MKIFGVKYLLILTPYHGNLGDQAIALSERQYFEGLGQSYIEISTRFTDENEKFLAGIVPKNAVVVIHGGGFIGSIWPHEELRARKMLEQFSDRRVIIFPQTVTFYDKTEEDKAFFEESKEIYSKNKHLTLFLRDRKSYEFVKANMPGVDARIVPDIVTLMKVENCTTEERSGILYCLRSDVEKSLSDNDKKHIKEYISEKYPDEKAVYTDTVINRFIGMNQREKVLRKKLQEFGNSKLVITDRLHGMVMAALTNTPCIALSNTNGKVGGVYRWISNNEFVKYVESPDSFIDALNNLDLDKKYSYEIDRKLFAELDGVIGGKHA